MRRYPKEEGGFYSKSAILEMAKDLYKDDAENLKIVRKLLRLKPTRTISGVAPITIFTKPYPCPGQCIFCPSQEGMPKSYLKEEPGAMRGKSLKFDPYEQVKLRMKALSNIGHNVDKIEIIISGGTWSFYEKGYREWFIEQTFKALNELPPSSGVIPDSDPGSRNSKTFLTEEEFSLQELHKMNETAEHRCVGLVIETRPDFINEKEVKHLRSLGVTKVQLGVQSLNSKVLELNKRGHTADDARNAISLLRLAGFKIHIHWMANLYGSSVEEDYEDFKKLFSDKSVRPDELKIYPCSVLENTPLYELMKQGEHIPFSETELVNLLVRCKRHIPQYCRVSRIIRDIPSQLIEGGSKTTNLRQLVQNKLKEQGLACQCIRCREIRNEEFSEDDLVEELLEYGTEVSKEFFLSYTANGKVVGFLRLSLPKKDLSKDHFIEELKNAAIIREVHVYGRALKVDSPPVKGKCLEEAKGIGGGETQHLGLGKKLIAKATKISRENDYGKISVISAIGTKAYYRKNGFEDGSLYQSMSLSH